MARIIVKMGGAISHSELQQMMVGWMTKDFKEYMQAGANVCKLVSHDILYRKV